MKIPIPRPAPAAPESLVREAIESWRNGTPPDAAEFLSANPEVRNRKSLAMDLIYEEYCLRHESGEALAPSTFCQKFPTYRQSLQRMLDVHQFMDAHPEGAEEKGWLWPESGETVLGFQILQKLGEGAIAKVYLAQQPDLGQRRVVVKISRNGATEAKLLGKLEHPGIVPIHSVHQDAPSGLTCICMPFLGTATLVDLLDLAFSKGKPPESAEILLSVARHYQPVGSREGDEPPVDPILRTGTYVEGVMHLGVQLAEALAAAHEAGVMHRDIKPSNVLLSRGARPMLLDFNLSSDLEMPLERVGGTVAYMAPERIQSLMADKVHAESKLDPRSDVYSLGALLYELLCGELPSRPDNPSDKQARLEEWLKGRLTPPEPPSKKNPAVDRHMEWAVLKALSPDPADRFASATEFARALQGSLAWKARAARWLLRNRRAALASVALLIVTIGIAIGAWASQPSREDSFYARGKKAYEEGDFKTAIESFTRALNYRPDSEDLLFARAQAYRQSKDFVLAQRDFQAVYNKNSNPEMLWFVGHCLLRQNSPNAAIGTFEKAIAGGFSSPQLLHNLAYSLSRVNQRDEALKHLDKVLELDESLALAHHLRARLKFYGHFGKQEPLPDSVRDDITSALTKISGDPLVHLDAACIFRYPNQSKPNDPAALKQLRLAAATGLNSLQLRSESVFLGKLPNQLTVEEQEVIQSRPSKPLASKLFFEPSLSLQMPVLR